MTELTTLEVLRAALASLEDPGRRYKYSSYADCTCGHIYRAAGGTRANQGGVVSMTGLKAASLGPAQLRHLGAMKAIIEANGLCVIGVPDDPGTVSFTVSHATSIWAEDHETDERTAAIALVREAVEHVEAREREAMLDVAAQAQEFCVPTTRASSEDAERAAREHVTR